MNRNLKKLLFAIVAVATAASLTACGSEDPKTSRVSGQWSLAASGEVPAATWKITPTCASGPCDFKVDFGLGQPKVTYKYDSASGTYTNKNSDSTDCLLPDGKTGAKDGITVSSVNVFTPTDAEKQNGAAVATRATVKSTMKTTTSASAKKAGCPSGDSSQSTSQTATLADK